jgi:uncharacterized protein YuzE
MARKSPVKQTVDHVFAALPHLICLPAGKAWIDYDQGADVLYLSFKRPQRATDTRYVDEEGILLRYRGRELVGMTVLDASKRVPGVDQD